jgi:membrane protein implicated in regulation of membrane protease activity
MCHLILALPIVALPVLWLLPLGVAIPIYAVTVGISVAVYATAMKAWRMPARHGIEALLGATGKVVRVEGRRVVLSVKGELWSADLEDESIAAGDKVVVAGFEGFRLKARKSSAGVGAGGRAETVSPVFVPTEENHR